MRNIPSYTRCLKLYDGRIKTRGRNARDAIFYFFFFFFPPSFHVSRPIPTTPSYREQARRRIILVDGTSCNRVARFWTAGERQAWNGSKRERWIAAKVGWNKSHGTFTMARLFIQLPMATRGVVSFINCTPASIFSWGANALSAKRGKTVTFARLPFIPTSPHCVNF